jgi:hypothetical protein
MRLGDLKLRKERLPRLPLPPVIAVEERFRIVGEVVVRFALRDLFAAADRARRGARSSQTSLLRAGASAVAA